MVGELTKQVDQEEITGQILGRPQNALLYDMELPLRKTFYPLGFAVEILTNDPEVLEAALESFGHVRENRGGTALQVRIGISEGSHSGCPPEPTRREYNHLYSLVADADNQALLDLKTCTSFAWLKKSTLQNRLYFRSNFLEKMVYLLLGASVVTDLHAACVGKEGKGILLCGDSGAGKSSLAYACARAGWTYTSDDTSYLLNHADAARIIGHAHRVRFRPAARELFPELAAYAVTPRMEGKPSIEILVSELPVPKIASESKIHAIVYLRRFTSAPGKLIRMPEGTGIQRMCSELFSAGDIRAQHERILRRAFADIPTYELEYSGLEDAIHEMDALTANI